MFDPSLLPYLQASTWIDLEHSAVRAKALALAEGCTSVADVAERCFTFVRDEIQHSLDHGRNPVTCRASDVLHHGTGYCYAKSHLLAALLRANGIPAGLCYQRLSVGKGGAPYCLHGLNAVYLPEQGWYRIDARGNKPGVFAAFTPPREQLAFAIVESDEADLPEIWAEPLDVVVQVLSRYSDVFEAAHALPDVQLARISRPRA